MEKKDRTPRQTVVFQALPATLEEFRGLPQMERSTPYDAAALTVAALCLFPKDRELCYAALDLLRGPRPLSPLERQFIADRFMDGKDYVPRSYFVGARPDNDYTPAAPYTLEISAGPYAWQEEGFAKLDLVSGGADSPRQVQLRLAKDGKWYLWEQFLLVDIRPPESANPWA